MALVSCLLKVTNTRRNAKTSTLPSATAKSKTFIRSSGGNLRKWWPKSTETWPTQPRQNQTSALAAPLMSKRPLSRLPMLLMHPTGPPGQRSTSSVLPVSINLSAPSKSPQISSSSFTRPFSSPTVKPSSWPSLASLYHSGFSVACPSSVMLRSTRRSPSFAELA